MIGKKNKILLIILIFIIWFNFSYPIVYAFGDGMVEQTIDQVIDKNEGTDYKTQTGSTNSTLGTIVDFGTGILFYPLKFIAFLFGKSIHYITENAVGSSQTVTPETILFNELDLTNINFFANNSSSDSFVTKLKTSIASWYYVMRTIAIVASLCILLYIAIRMTTSTLASDKAEYKRMLVDWLVGFVLIFVLHYIIILVISGNNLIVDTLKTTIETQDVSGMESSDKLENFLDKMEEQVLNHVDLSKSLGAIIVYLILVLITLAFLLMYIKRMIVVAFLIIIAPLITITYSIDKVSDSKSQALDAWLKEFVWTVLIQPFHCIIYVVFVSVSLQALNEASFSSAVLAIMCMVFILQAEDIVKKIFGIQADNIGKMSNSVAMAAGGALIASKLGGKASGKAGKTVGKVADKATKMLPKTNDGTGVGTGPVSKDYPHSLSQKVANIMADDVVQKRLKSFNNFMENTKGGRALGIAGRGVGNWANVSYKGATTLTGVAFNMPGAKGLQNLVEGGFAGYAAGQALQTGAKWIYKKGSKDIIESGRTRNAKNNLNESYKQLQQETGFNDEQMFEKAKRYLKMDLNSENAKLLKDTEKLFAYNLQVMKHQLEKAEADTSFNSVISHIKLKDNNNKD